MNISIEIEGESIELPKKTLKIAKLIDEAKSATSTEKSYKSQYKVVTECVGKENADKLLDGNNLESVDLVSLSILFLKIENSYLSPVVETREEFESYGNQKTIDAFADLGNAAEKISKLADFKK